MATTKKSYRADVQAAIEKAFKASNVTINDEVTAHTCASFCVTFEMTPTDLVNSWEAFTLNIDADGNAVTAPLLDGFRTFLTNERLERMRSGRGQQLYTKDTIDDFFSMEEDTTASPSPPRRNSTATPADSPSPSATAALPPLSPATALPRAPADGEPRTPGLPTTLFRTPVPGKRPGAVARSPVTATPFSRRTNRRTSTVMFNDHVAQEPEAAEVAGEVGEKKPSPPMEDCHVSVLGAQVDQECRFMYDRLQERFSAIDARIQRFTEALVAAGHVPSTSFHACQDEVLLVGRICGEAEAMVDARLLEKSVYLEGGAEQAAGERVRVELRDLPAFSLFPGQVVAIRGRNPTGHCLVASAILDSLPPPSAADYLLQRRSSPAADEEGPATGASTPATLPGSKRARLRPQSLPQPLPTALATKRTKPLSVVVAAGPMSTTDNLCFEPLQELLAYAREKRPHVLVLIGPFVDLEHPLIKSGACDRTFRQIFQEEVHSRVEEYLHEMGAGARVVLAPSARDVIHDPVVPQPPLPEALCPGEEPEQWLRVGNPACLSVAEVTLGLTSADVLFQLSTSEISRMPAVAADGSSKGGPAPVHISDRMSRLASHVIGQRTFLPVFPPPPSTPVDLSLAPPVLELPFTPDLLLLPSTLQPFVKVLNSREGSVVHVDSEKTDGSIVVAHPGKTSLSEAQPLSPKKMESSIGRIVMETVCVNPGRLARGENGGTFAHIWVAPEAQQVAPQELEQCGKRTRVRILRV